MEQKHLLLTEQEIQQVIEQAKIAFPKFTDWKYNNEVNEEYSGFSLWGEIVLKSDDFMSRSFFVTLDTYEEQWYGHVTIGQPAYFWTSADFGDAQLVDTEACKTFEDAIVALKKEIASLFELFS
jgi:hypothetical protein